MKTFLEYIAEDMLTRFSHNMARTAVVCPNKRAAIFLDDYLAKRSTQPIWSPTYITISELFRNYSSRTVADPLKLICELHKSFSAQTGIDETLDHFFSWGQLLLADFDDIDKNMANADQVFQNVGNIHELDDVSWLSEQQKAALKRFFSNFTDDHQSLLKERFLKLWSKMGNIYHDFNQRLEQQQLAYEGALYREVAESFAKETPQLPYDSYLFVGFNMLQSVEQQLFTAIKQQGKALFYWDFDHDYMTNNEAGHFIRQYLADFPNALDTDSDDIYRQYEKPKNIMFISATSENSQARYTSKWLREGTRISDGRSTAVVLCNESLLPTIIHCLPDEVEKVNITTGYPLIQAPVASLITQLITLRISGFNEKRQAYMSRFLEPIMRHPYMSMIESEEARTMLNDWQQQLLPWMCNILRRLAQSSTQSTTQDDNDPLQQESIFKAYTLLNRLKGLYDSGDLNVDIITMQRLIAQLMQSTSIPFHGEPAEGIQIMGILETRNLDFEHLVILSCNDGNMPRNVNDASFIPYNIRKAFALTTIDHKVAIYSYYFHRLLQRASDITILYNNSTNDGQTGEMSRFMLQMMVEDAHHSIRQQTLQMPTEIRHTQPPVIVTPKETKPAFLSPTAINTYMRCQLRYYYKYECGITEPLDDNDDSIDNRIFGNIFHEAAQDVYTRLMQNGNKIRRGDINSLLKSRVEIIQAVEKAMQRELEAQQHATLDINGLHLINREVLVHYLRQLLEIDSRLAPFTILGLECDVKGTLSTPHITTQIGGRIDRLDCIEKDGRQHVRVIDYKTGGRKTAPLADVESIFQQKSLTNHSDYYLQAMLYSVLVKKSYPQTPVSPALLFIQHAGGKDYDPTLCFGRTPITDISDYSDRFIQLLEDIVDEMFNPDISYTPTDNSDLCRYCPYKLLCKI